MAWAATRGLCHQCFRRNPHIATKRMAGAPKESERQHALCATNAFDGASYDWATNRSMGVLR
eukprot:205395-Pyramimonas_sp.AAC.1